MFSYLKHLLGAWRGRAKLLVIIAVSLCLGLPLDTLLGNTAVPHLLVATAEGYPQRLWGDLPPTQALTENYKSNCDIIVKSVGLPSYAPKQGWTINCVVIRVRRPTTREVLAG